MTRQYHTAVVGVVMLIAALVGGASAAPDDDVMMCYKPPPPANATTDDHTLFHFDVNLSFQIHVSIERESLTYSIYNQCGAQFYMTYRIGTLVLQEISWDCAYKNKSRPVETPLPLIESQVYYYRQGDDIMSEVYFTVTLDRIVASDGTLALLCQLVLPPSSGSLISNGFVNFAANLKLQGCPHARYGVDCDRLCSCAEGVECHPFNGDCVCPRGLQGVTCSQVQPMLLLGNPTTVFVHYGESVTLTCTAYGMVPLLRWWDYGNRTLDTRSGTENVPYHPRPYNVETTVTATSTDVNGVYTCSVVNNGSLYSKNVTVIVTGIPHPFLETPSNQSVILGNRAELHCRTKPEAGTLTWMRGDQILSQLPEESNQTIGQSVVVRERNQTVSIIFKSAQFEDAGKYRCIVGHQGGNDLVFKDAWLTVQSQGSRPHVSTPGRTELSDGVLRIQEDQPVRMMCQIDEAYPKPSISWFVGEENRTAAAKVVSRTSENGVSFDVDSLLTIRPSWRDNGKIVVCISNVPNFWSNQSQEVHLNVSYTPKVSISPKDMTFQPDDSPTFVCDTLANPPVTRYNWTLRGKEERVVKTFTNRSITFHRLTPAHNGATLSCSAENDVGFNISKAVIRVFDEEDNSEFHLVFMIAGLSALLILMLVIPALICKHRGKIQDLFFNNKRAPNFEGKTHDIFVAYKGSGEEEEFVTHTLIPKLEEWGCKVYIDYQNFLPGREITDNITLAVSSSRKTLLVLSPDFMASEWCYFEFLCAMDEMLRKQTNFIIPLMFKDIRGGELCRSMQNLLDTVSFVPWPAGSAAGQGQINEFWELLKRAVETEYNVSHAQDANEERDDENGEDVMLDENVNFIQFC